MKFYKKILHVLLICLLLITSFLPQGDDNDGSSIVSNLTSKLDHSIVDSLFNSQKAEALYDGPDWTDMAKNSNRVRLVDDSDLKPLILFKAKLKLGWSASEALAVGDYMYVTASIPSSEAGSRNFFSLPSGTYLYRIPVDFKFQGNLSDSELRMDLLTKGAKVVRLTSFVQNHSSATYNPSNGTFYVGVYTEIYAVRESDMALLPNKISTGARLTAVPTIVGNDLFNIATSTAVQTGKNGAAILVKGLASGNPTVKTYRLDSHPTAEIPSVTVTNSANEIVIPVNYRDSANKGVVTKYTVQDNGFSGIPSMTQNWQTYTDVGVPPPVTYYDGYVYAAAKYGSIYKLNASTGSKTWVSKISGASLINNTPVTDGSYLYVSVRRPGKMVKINMSSGNQVWSIAAGRQINGSVIDTGIETGKDIGNNPTIWNTPDGRNILFYGTTGGDLIFKTTDGYRTNVALDRTTGTIARSSIVGGNVISGVNWEYQGTGMSTGILLAKNHLVFGVNTSSNFGETLFYSVGIADDVYVKSVEGGDYQGKQDVITDVVVGSKEFGAGLRAPMVRLYVDGVLVGEKRIDLNPGEEKTVKFVWQVADNITDGQITATINIEPEFVETDMTNNTMTADYTSGFGYNICLPNERNNTAIVETVTYEDSEGNSYTVDYYEYLETEIEDIQPEKLRAGYGFEFVTNVHYFDETSTYSGPQKVTSTFPDSPNFVDSVVEKEQTSATGPSYDERSVWELPLIYVEYYSGNVFHDLNDGNMDNEDELVVPDGERKWYTDFYTPDGPYIFKSVASEAGKNDLTSCWTDYVEIKGTPFDDYVRRSVIPDTPFLDDEVGYNWQGNEVLIGDLNEEYYNPNNNVDSASTYYLSNEIIKEIKDDQLQTVSKSEASYFFSSFDFN